MSLEITELITNVSNFLATFLPKLALASLVLLLGYFVARYIQSLIMTRLLRLTRDPLTRDFLAQFGKWVVFLLAVIWALDIIGLGGVTASLVAGAGISALIIGFALKDIGENLLSGIALAFKPPFTVGDLIETNGVKGTVQAINIRTTHILNAEGEQVYIPNSMILKSILTKHMTSNG